MNTSMRARRDALGFSMVELLVTIIIAGIAFAAIVPLFVMAQDKNSGDTFRNVATQMAQDRIELIRQLDYDQINDANLKDDDFPTVGADLFSTEVDYYGGSTTSMKFYVQTRVTLVIDGVSVEPSAATLGTEQFKTVAVTTWWGPADPARAEKLTKLQTQVYKQYAGPQILIFTAAELFPQPLYGANLSWIKAMPLTLQATIAEIDRPETGTVRFSIRDATKEVDSIDVAADTPPGGTYTWVYDGPTKDGVVVPLNDGLYTVSAQAKSTKNFSGNLVSLSITVERGPPDAPTIVSAQPGGGSVSLTWTKSTAADFDHFEVYRSDSSAGTYAKRGETTGNILPSYVDIDNSFRVGRDYYYIVYAVDKMGTALEAQGKTYRSPASAPVPVVMQDVQDKTAPPVPTWAGSPTLIGLAVTLVWNGVIDGPPESDPTEYVSGTQQYIVTRQSSSDGGVTWPPKTQIQLSPIVADPAVLTQSATDNSLTYGLTYRYSVTAMDVAGRASVSEWTTVAVPLVTRTLRVDNKNGQPPVYVYVTSTDNLVFFNQSGTDVTLVGGATAATVTIAKNGFANWTLPDGNYNLYYSRNVAGPFILIYAPKTAPSVTVP